ncbi:ABC transporter ATP-binding protein [Spirochaeta isovalerica]|uniref:ATP-binding cassette subfamily B protein n=1 Tax=Spirochaeta isovalerica TaxID=150 RepID=A0A841R4I8_9SPIO|nr:ABC transporter ATP-binding protein [Spirochaeta isovalerica]MBB6480044.1 ATP-binding cassette subfamily B protein [Spirochaeta isovalerica]
MSDNIKKRKESLKGSSDQILRRGPRPGGGRGPQGMMKGESAKDFKKGIGRLLRYMGKYRYTVLVVFVFASFSTVFMILGPKIMGQATTKLFEGIMAKIAGTGEIDFASIRRILLLTLGLYGISALFSYIMGWIMSSVSADLSYRFRKDIAEKMHKIPLRYYDGNSHGDVLSRITNDVDTINQTLSQTLTQMITSVVTVAGVLVMMFSIDWRMTLTALLIIPLSMGTVAFIVKKSQKYFKRQQASLGHVNGHIEEMFSAHIIMQAFNGQEKSLEEFGVFNEELHESAWKSQFLSGLMMPLMMVFGNISYVAVTILGGWLAVRNMITIGDIQAFIQYVRNFTQPLTQIANISNVLQQTVAAAERVFEFLDEEQEIAEKENPVKPDTIRGEVEFKNVRFSYNKKDPVIRDFSAVAGEGKKIAIVGPTGAGKTTMVKLLMRYYDVDSGAILVDGMDIRDFTRKDLRNNFAMVLQDTWLYNSTVRENIRYGRTDATDEEVEKAAGAAHVDHFIHTWPDGYDMIINEETSNISQGQKQLLTIARAILADPRILILDEATSSVDTRTEVLIQKAMDGLMEGRTSFIIAHRLSTIRNADLILVMNEGDIIEQGSHEELMGQNGFYADLYNSQFEHVTI